MVLVGIVNVEHVDAVGPQPIEALCDRAEHALLAEIEDGIDVGRAVVEANGIGIRHLSKQPADLCRDDDLISRNRVQRATEPRLSESVPIPRSGVEEADSCSDRCGDLGSRVIVANGFVEARR